MLFLAAYTARSQAYAQAMARSGISPRWVATMGKPVARSLPQTALRSTEEYEGIFFPDLRVSVEETCSAAGWEVLQLANEDVNSGEVAVLFEQLQPRLVIYSGYGGQIVGPELLDLGIPFLHVHSGWLPQERGSTTIYYRLLERGTCAASAFVLSQGIDTGELVARKEFPPPPSGMDIDYLYDPAIRADLLIDVLRGYALEGLLPYFKPATHEVGLTYYVIHPVLKHLALLSLHNGSK